MTCLHRGVVNNINVYIYIRNIELAGTYIKCILTVRFVSLYDCKGAVSKIRDKWAYSGGGREG